MTDPTQDTPPTLVERLRLTADYLAAGCVFPAKPYDGSEDPLEPVDDVTLEVEELRDLASLYSAAADALDKAQAEIASLTVTRDPPNRAPLLAQLEALLTSEPTNLGPIREAIRVIRTEAQLREVTRAALKDWHGWARKLSRAEGDEYANAMRATLQARIAAQHKSGRLALLVEPVRRRVELVQALCADIGLGAEEAAELAPRAALWTDAEVAEIEAFRVRDWSGTGLNPFEHLPPALERAVYPGPGGRRAYLQRIGDPLPPGAPASAVSQLGLPGLPKPETALRLRLALVNKPDSPEAGLVAEFAQALLEKLDAVHGSRDLPADYHPWMASDWVDEVRAQVRLHIQKGDPRDVAVYCAFAWHHGWSLTQEPQESAPALEAIEARFTELHFLAEPNRVGFRFEGVPFDIRVPDEDAKAMRRKLIETFTDTSTTRMSAQSIYQRIANVCTALTEEYDSGLPHTALLLLREAMPLLRAREGLNGAPHDLPAPPGYTPWISMGNSGWAFEGVRVADDVVGAWSHAWGLQPEAALNLRKLVVAAARSDERNAFGGWLVTTFQHGAVDEAAVLCPNGEYESGDEFCRRVLQLALDRGAFSVDGPKRHLGANAQIRQWVQVASGLWDVLAEIEGLDPSDTELSKVQFRGEVRRLARRRLEIGGPPPMATPAHPLDVGHAPQTADLAARAKSAAENLRHAMGHTHRDATTILAMNNAAAALDEVAAGK